MRASPDQLASSRRCTQRRFSRTAGQLARIVSSRLHPAVLDRTAQVIEPLSRASFFSFLV